MLSRAILKEIPANSFTVLCKSSDWFLFDGKMIGCSIVGLQLMELNLVTTFLKYVSFKKHFHTSKTKLF